MHKLTCIRLLLQFLSLSLSLSLSNLPLHFHPNVVLYVIRWLCYLSLSLSLFFLHTSFFPLNVHCKCFWFDFFSSSFVVTSILNLNTKQKKESQEFFSASCYIFNLDILSTLIRMFFLSFFLLFSLSSLPAVLSHKVQFCSFPLALKNAKNGRSDRDSSPLTVLIKTWLLSPLFLFLFFLFLSRLSFRSPPRVQITKNRPVTWAGCVCDTGRGLSELRWTEWFAWRGQRCKCEFEWWGRTRG